MILHDVLVDALAEARLEQMHLTDRELRRGSPSWVVRTRTRPRPWETGAQRAPSGAAPSLRLRLGRALLALGAAVAGEDESAPARRVA